MAKAQTQSKATSAGVFAPLAAGVAAGTLTFWSPSPHMGEKIMTQSQPAQPKPTAPTATVVSVELLNAKLEGVEARAETNFAKLIGKLDLLADRIGGVQTSIGELDGKIAVVDSHARSAKTTIIATVIGAAIGIVGLAFAAVAIFQSAMSTTASAYQSGMTAAEARKK